MSPTLVTGGSGYVATHLVAGLLRDGVEVRTTVRAPTAEAELRAAVRRGGADDAGLQVVVADLSRDDGWDAALAGVEEVHHVASPIPVEQPDDPDELVRPARDGTLRVLRAAVPTGARRVVLTSSFAAVGYSPKAEPDFTEADWTDPDTPGLAPYPRSKAVAERAAWDFMDAAGGGTDLVVVNPTGVFGPTLTTRLGSSVQIVRAMLQGTMPVAPRARFGVVDVRDVADLHRRAMASPAASGQRFLAVGDDPATSFVGLAAVLREHLGAVAAAAPTAEVPGPEPAVPVIHNDRARTVLGWRPRPSVQTIVDTARSLLDLGLVPSRTPTR